MGVSKEVQKSDATTLKVSTKIFGNKTCFQYYL